MNQSNFTYNKLTLNATISSTFLNLTFTGKERDEETGYGYFGARYYDADLLTRWISVDPKADKYPSLSPYNYCAWNPVRVVDPKGMDTLHLFATNLLDQDQNEKNLSILRWMRADGDVAGMVTLSMHGSSRSVALPLHNGAIEIFCDASNYATFIKNQLLPDYESNKRNGKNTIFLLYSCNTREGCSSFAEQLSNSLGEITIAPEGEIVIGEKKHSMRNCVSKSDDMAKPWNVYFRGRIVSSFTGILPKEWINSMGGVDNAVEEIIAIDRKKHPWE